ncbi:5-formyltetrahydrofolate cyclo-ligase [bacterium]|nr:5-formyltetrahydrofolate cyclo-ligase [bacterium]
MSTLRNSLSESDKKQNSQEICNKIESLDWFSDAKTVALFVPIRGEVDLTILFKKSEKRLVLPLVKNKTELSFHSVETVESLTKGSYGILEPNPEIHQEVNPDEIDLFLVPGLGFSKIGERIGYGGGYYDRILAKKQTDAHSLGVGFDIQIVQPGFSEEYDVALDGILTEKRMLFII